MFSDALLESTTQLLADFRAKSLTIVTAESCTGGLIGGLLTEIAGSSDVFDRGFITYSNYAKNEVLSVPKKTLVVHGAVSAQTAAAMVRGALAASRADVAVAVTGIAGPGGGTPEKPEGLVHMAAGRREGDMVARECLFGPIGRGPVRLKTIDTALELLREAMG